MAGKILVTGATGTVGTLLVRELQSLGAQVKASVHTEAKADRIKGLPNVEPVRVDYKDGKTVEAAFEGVEKLYLLTPFVPEQAEIAELLVDAAKKAGIRHIVKQSGMGADAVSGITIGRLHRRAEKYIEASGIPHTFIRPNFFMQNFINYFSAAMKTEGKIYLPVGGGEVSYIDARDIARAAATVLTNQGHEGKIYTLTGPEALTVYEVAGEFSKVSGRRITYVDIPEKAARAAMHSVGMNEWSINAMMELHSICRAGYASTVTDTVEKLTGRKPTTFARFARDYASALRGS